MYLGTCYYPEHWPEERWAKDAELMKKCGFNVVRLAEFAWSKLEPKEGKYEFDWLDKVIALLSGQAIKVILGTPTASPPAWLIKKHPQVLSVDENGLVKGFGSRRHYCVNNPVYRDYTQAIVSRMADRYKANESVIGWQIDNELGCHETTRCYCDNCQKEFRHWLRAKYKTLKLLNEEWGTIFWSQTYSGWNQIPLPRRTIADHSPSLLLDFYRFASGTMTNYLKLQRDIIRSFTHSQFITHNLMGNFSEIDYYQLSESLDFVSWDNYNGKNDRCFVSDLMRGLKGKNYWVMEQQCGHVNWDRYNPSSRPDEVCLWSYHAIAHGGEGLVYFRWRACRFGAEQYHSGLLKHDGTPARGYLEAKRVGAELKKIKEKIKGSQVTSQVGLIYSYDQQWALDLQPHNRLFSYQEHLMNYYRALRRLNVSVDILHPEKDFSRYKLVIAPTLYLLNERITNNLYDYVRKGGILVLTLRSGVKNWNNVVTDKPLPGELRELTGVRIEEFVSLPPDVFNEIEIVDSQLRTVAAGPFRTKIWGEILQPETAEVLAEYGKDYYRHSPAVTINKYGRGYAIYIGTVIEDGFYESLLQWLLAKSKIGQILKLPKDVEVCVRLKGKEEIYFVLNHSRESKEIRLDKGRYKDLISGREIRRTVEMQPKQTMVLIKE